MDSVRKAAEMVIEEVGSEVRLLFHLGRHFPI